ncbi:MULTISPECIES: hypothetical protein [Methanosarcina]|uniref:Uncharacterized protein n=1 Tax=Methanosarcina barkeri CM1 TaxID=796385 RepID=A0A0G3CF45_METBA|nr:MULTISPECIES: hypothetical protein [Methanosarcina]AKJ37707.1 hypothetical protein MCM1_0615 [Methanosarcina barkeri CM1]OED06807.1 hypothetical protein A9239_11025 [Methanosarcina sp. A14]
MSRPASQISNLENKVIQELKSEVLQFRKSTDEKTSMETRNIHGDERKSMENKILDIIAS